MHRVKTGTTEGLQRVSPLWGRKGKRVQNPEGLRALDGREGGTGTNGPKGKLTFQKCEIVLFNREKMYVL